MAPPFKLPDHQTTHLPNPSDPSLETFKRYDCNDGSLLHGTFLIDEKGVIQGSNIGSEPFMDVDELLQVSRAILRKR